MWRGDSKSPLKSRGVLIPDGTVIGGGLGRGRELPNIPSNSDAELLLVELSGEAEDGIIVTEEEGKMETEVEAFARIDGKDVAFVGEEKIETVFEVKCDEVLALLEGFEVVVIGEFVESV